MMTFNHLPVVVGKKPYSTKWFGVRTRLPKPDLYRRVPTTLIF